MEQSVTAFFERYAEAFNQALHRPTDLDNVASLYTAEFIAASPAGVMAGKNDDSLRAAMATGYDHYRAIGTKDMRLLGVDITRIDNAHCLARVHWMAIYDRGDAPDVEIEFDVHYLVQVLDEEPRVFGWITGDEQELLREKGII